MHQSRDIFIGANALDTPAYPDCRPDYLTAFETMANLAVPPSAANEPAIRIQAPVLYLDKSAVITLGQELNVDFSQTISCYQATDAGLACGVCASCGQRRRGFERAGLADPTRYQRS